MKPQSQREAEREAGRKRLSQWEEHWEEHKVVKHPLTREAQKDAVTRLLMRFWAVRLRPGMYIGEINHETIALWLYGLEAGLSCTGLKPPADIVQGVTARRPRHGSAYTLHDYGFPPDIIVEEVLSLQIDIFETWLRILNDDWTWNRELLHQTLCRFPGASRGYPFDAATGVYTVGGKVFALVAEDADPLKITVKCESDRAAELRRVYACIGPDCQRSKPNWNTIMLDASVPIIDVWQWMQDSYDLVYNSLKRKQREQIHQTET